MSKYKSNKEILSSYVWLKDARYKNQSFMLQLFEYNKRKMSETHRRIFNLLVGINFSLWRAAFLVDENRDDETIIENADFVLDKLIADNAINYYQDKAARQWMSGYYINNAGLRLIEIKRILESESINYDNISFPAPEYYCLLSSTNLLVDWDSIQETSIQVFNNVIMSFASIKKRKKN